MENFLHVTVHLNTRKWFPICMFVGMASGKWELHIQFTFLQEFENPQLGKNLIFFCIIYVAMSNNHFSVLDNVKMTTKVSLKITARKRCVYIEIGSHWKQNQCFYLGIWNDDRTKMVILPSFQLATRLNSKNINET